MDNNKNDVFSLSVNCLGNLKYMGSNTAWAIMSIIRRKIVELDELANDRANVMSIIELSRILQRQIILQNVMQKTRIAFDNSRCKPIISFMRTRDWFFVGENVICMINQRSVPDVATAVKCHIVDIVDTNDKVIIFVSTNDGCDFVQREGDCFGSYLVDSLCIMKRWEYNFLLRDVTFAKIWTSVSKSQKYQSEIFNVSF